MSKSNTFRRLGRHGKRGRRFVDGYRGFKTIGRHGRCGRHFLGGRKTMQTQKTNTTSQNHNTLPNKTKGVRDEI